MFLTSYLPIIPLLLLCLSPSNAYKIDASCANQNDLVRSGAQQAFAMAQGAATALNASPRDPNVNRLIKLLFCGPNDDPATINLDKAKGIFNGIGRMANEITGPTPKTMTEMVIYCDLKRVVKSDAGEWVDTGSNTIIEDLKSHPLNECGTTSGTLAFVWNPPRTWEEVANAPGTTRAVSWPSQVTICPWFLSWSAGKEYSTWKDVSAKAKLAKWAIPKIVKGWPFTPVDALNLFDKVLLHEFTHTVSGGQTVDVPMSSGGAPFFNTAYGWKAANNLANQAPTDPDDSPQNNADTLALFGSGVRMLQNNPVLYIANNGDVTETQPSSKRDILSYATTPADFEGFVTLIKQSYASQSADPEAYWRI